MKRTSVTNYGQSLKHRSPELVGGFDVFVPFIFIHKFLNELVFASLLVGFL